MEKNKTPSEFKAPTSQNHSNHANKLNARSATKIFLSYILTQLFIGFLAGVITTVGYLTLKQGSKTKEGLEKLITSLQLPYTVVALIVASTVMILLSIKYGKEQIRNRSNKGIAWVAGNRSYVLLGLVSGLIVATLYIFMAVNFFPPDPNAPLSPLLTMVYNDGMSRIFWVFFVLILAPPVEEFLFRGVLISGYSRSFGIIKASVLSTVLFVLIHSFEAIYYLPAYIGITGIGILALVLRLKSRALGPSVAAHFGYNLIITIVAFTSLSKI